MSQRTEEETEFKVPETITLCVNNCGLIGNPGTNNMCQKCFNASTPTTAATTTTTTASSSAAVISVTQKFTRERNHPRSSLSRSPKRSYSSSSSSKHTTTKDLAKSDEPAKREVNRCSGCRKRVGLTGFRCRCGELFCADHRYSDRHVCSYDYKTAGRETIARDNPLVRASKIVRI